MKKLFRVSSIVAVIIAALVLVGCNKTTDQSSYEAANAAAIAADYDELVAKYPEGTVITISSKDALNLPTSGSNGSTISWESSDTTVVSHSGVPVQDPSTELVVDSDGYLVLNQEATLTAVITKGKSVTSKKWTVSVKKADSFISETANKILVAYSALLNNFEGKELSGYKLTFVSGQAIPIYTLDFPMNQTVTVVYQNSKHISFDGGVATVVRPTAKEANNKGQLVEDVTVKLTVDDVSYSVALPVLLSVDAANYVTLAEVKTLLAGDADVYKDKVYVFKGTVTEMHEHMVLKDGKYSGYKSYCVQDGEDALYIYSDSTSTYFAEGYLVLITSTITSYSGLGETSKVSATQVLADATANKAVYDAIKPISVTSDKFSATGLAGKDCCVCSCDRLIYLSGTMSSGNSARLSFIFPDLTTKATVTIDKYTDTAAFDAIMAIVNALQPGDSIKINHGNIGWYKGPQFVLNYADAIVKLDTALSDSEKVALDKANAKAPYATVGSGSSNALSTTSSFGSTISWSLDTATDPIVTIVDSKLNVGPFTTGFEFTLIETITSGSVSDTVEFKVAAVAPVTLNALVAAINDGKYADGTALQAVVYDVQGSTVILSDGTDYIVATLADGLTAPVAGNKLVVTTAKAAKSTLGVYSLNVTAIQANDAKTGIYAGKIVAIADLDASLTKVQLKGVTIASGVAAKSATVNVNFYTDLSMKTAYTDGTYDYVEGYSVPVSDTVIGFVVTKVYNSFAYAVTNVASKPTVTLRGAIVLMTGTKAAWIANEEGKIIEIYAAANLAYKTGDFVEVTGAVETYNMAIEFNNIAVSAITLLTKAEISMADSVKALADNGVALTSDFSAYGVKAASQYTLVTVSGLTYKSGFVCKTDGTPKLFDFSLKAITDDYEYALPSNMIFTDAAGVDFYFYLNKAEGNDSINGLINSLASAIKEPSKYTITVSGVLNGSWSDTNTYTKHAASIICSSIVVTAK